MTFLGVLRHQIADSLLFFCDLRCFIIVEDTSRSSAKL
eukprot:CAMPEP_0194704574 /NCGR_PEP_ID=MMETSP0295-20121207/28370_1 /TAXON_ID=39354 /ORGANISM="Heterosigma akashiwo, Strain CCMP2393" /LENGTH=37 /DNA_ID= /DNA_START= /DNA_END= /DNA_ORIENTATION=